MPLHKPVRTLACLVTAFAAGSVAAPVAAYVPLQLNTMPNFAANMANTMLINHSGQVLMQQNGARGGSAPGQMAAGQAASGQAPSARTASTRFTPSPQVSAEVKAAFLQKLSQALGPDRGPKVAAVFANRDPVALWMSAMARNGFHANDMADALASYFVLSWCMANRADLNTPQVIAVRDQMQRAMATGQVAPLPESGRQVVAETAMLEFDVQSAIYANALHQHDEASVAKLGDMAEQRFLAEEKIDLRQLTITGQGLTRKT